MLALVLALAVSDPKLDFETEQAQAAFDEANEAFAAEDYERAADALARAYALEPLPKLLYAQAQAERLAGRCASASPLYIEYLDTRPSADVAALVQWNLSLCLATMSLDAGACDQAQTQLGAIRPDAEGDQVKSQQLLELEVRLEVCRSPEPVPAPEPEPELEPVPEPPPPVVEPTPPPPAKRLRIDPWGVGLGAGSLLAAGAAVGLFLAGGAQIEAVSLEGTHARARSRHELGRALTGGSIGAAAAAGGLAVGAVVHWLVWRKR